MNLSNESGRTDLPHMNSSHSDVDASSFSQSLTNPPSSVPMTPPIHTPVYQPYLAYGAPPASQGIQPPPTRQQPPSSYASSEGQAHQDLQSTVNKSSAYHLPSDVGSNQQQPSNDTNFTSQQQQQLYGSLSTPPNMPPPQSYQQPGYPPSVPMPTYQPYVPFSASNSHSFSMPPPSTDNRKTLNFLFFTVLFYIM